MDKQRMLAVTKTDLLDPDQERSLLRRLPRSLPVLLISSVTGKNIPQLKEQIWNILWNQ